MVKNKHTVRRRLILPSILLAFLLFIVGGTIAYNTNEALFNNLFHLKYGETTSTEDFTSPDNWKTCDETPKEVVTRNDSTFNIRVRLSYDEWWRDKADENYLPLTRNGERLTTINLQNENDWEDGNDGWMYWKGTLAPGESTRSLLKSVTYNCRDAITENVCHETPTGTVCEKPTDPYDEANYHVFVTVQTTEENGEFPDDTFYNLSINPNGGTYNGSDEIYTDRVKAGSIIDLSSIERTDFEFRDWTLNETDTFTNNMIRIDSDTSLVANWLSNVSHTVTVNPNGGTYDGKTETSTYEVREGDIYNILDAVRDSFALEGWQYTDESFVSGDSLTVNDDIAIKAIWAPAVARIERTGKLYTSIMRAEAEAITDDTITLLVDTEEVVTNEKKVTLDLNTHTVTGSLTNTENGNLTLINGEINNPNGAAVTNNGTFTMGINDYKADNTANIVNNYVRLIGTNVGIKQNATFNFYDGFIEGDISIDGDYDSAPYYHNVEQSTDIYYYPYITHNELKDCQHAELASADNSVSKTIVGGDIYYLNLQDNINTSARTGYKIYAVRDFNATYPLTVAENTSIEFDIAGYEVMFADTLTNNGNLTISNSKSTGKISNSQTIINNASLTINNAEIRGTTQNDTIRNNATVTLRGGTLSATTGYVIQPINDTTLDMDDNSYIRSYSDSYAAIRSSSNFTISAGHVAAPYIGIQMTGGTFTMTGGSIEVERDGGNTFGISCNSNSGCVINLKNNSTITVKNATPSGSANEFYGIYKGNTTGSVTMEDNSSITVQSNNWGAGIYNGGTVVLDDNSSIAVNTSGSAYGITSSWTMELTADSTASVTVNGGGSSYGLHQGDSYVKGGSVSVTSRSGDAQGINCDTDYQNPNHAYVSGGSVTATTTGSGTAYGIYGGGYYLWGGTINISGGSVKANSNTGTSYGFFIRNDDYSNSGSYVSGGTIEAHSTSGASYGANLRVTKNYITGGTIISDDYGVYANGNSVTIGEDVEPISIEIPEIIGGKYAIYSGSYNFFDGVLRGDINAYQDGVIKAIPDATIYHTERALGPEDDPDTPEDERTGRESCWLVPSEDYLEVGGVAYNSLKKAYDAITGDSGTIKVIKDVRVEATLPASPAGKTITFDLNGHLLTYTQSITNNSIMTFIDSSAGQTGRLNNPNTYAIINASTLNIQSGVISSENADSTIYNNGGKTLNITGGTILSTYIGVRGGGTITATSGLIQVARDGGSAYGIYCDNSNCAINLEGDAQITVKNATPSGGASTYNGIAKSDSNGSITIKGDANITVQSNGDAYGINNGGTVLMDGNGSITATAGGRVTGIYTSRSVTFAENSNANLNITGGWSAIGTYYADTIVNGGSIKVTSNGGGEATAINCETTYQNGNYANITGGSVEAINTANGAARGIYGGGDYLWGGSISVSGGTVKATSNSGNSFGYHIINDNYGNSGSYISGGIVEAHSTSGTSYGGYIAASRNYVTGGKIISDSYGIYGNGYTITIGEEAEPTSQTDPEIIGGKYAIYSGSYNFYDGVLRGDTNAYQDGVIKAIPDAKLYHVERALGPEDNPDTPEDERTGRESCWLIDAESYLEVDGVAYNSLKKAYNAITGNSGTIKVIANTRIEATLPASPADKAITFDLNGHELIYTQSIVNSGTMTVIDSSTNHSGSLTNPNTYIFTNNGTLNIESGNLVSSNTALYNGSGSTINISGGIISAPVMGVRAASNSVTDLSDQASLIIDGNNSVAENYGIYCDGGQCSTTMSGNSNITVSGATSAGFGFSKESGGASLTMKDNSSINVTSRGTASGSSNYSAALQDNASISVSGSWNVYGVFGGNSQSVTIADNSTVNITATGGGNVYGIGSSDAYIHSGTISATSTSTDPAYGIGCDAMYQDNVQIIIYGGAITATASGSSDAYGVWANGYDLWSSSISIEGGTISSISNTGNSFAVRSGNENSTNTNISGGTIDAASTNGVGYGFYAGTSTNLVTGGKITGKNYGIYGNGRLVTLGENDGNISTTSPEIIGGNYAFHSGSFNFYDGILKGGIDPFENADMINSIATDSTVIYDTETIDGTTYQTSYLTPEYDCAQIGDTKYKKLSAAISDAEANDTIELIADNYIFEAITIDSSKDITIETNGYNITTSHPIANNGKVKLVNSNSSSAPTFNYRGSQYYITNGNNAELELDNTKIKAVNGISNSGTLKIVDSSIEASSTGIAGAGNVTLNNATITARGTGISTSGTIQSDTNDRSIISGANYGIYNNGGTINLNTASLSGTTAYYQTGSATASFTASTLAGILTNNAGTININGGTVSRIGNDINSFIVNGDTLNIDGATLTFTSENLLEHYQDTIATMIHNSSSLSLKDINFDINISGSVNKTVYAINNTGSQLTLDNANIITSLSDMVSDSGTYYGIYNHSGNVNYIAGAILVNLDKSYGIYNETGEITLGSKEDPSAQGYGTPDANVSTTNPSIRAIGATTGIGIKNGTGRVNFYDGIVTGNTHPMPDMPDIPTKTEYHFEARLETGSDNYQNVVLRYIQN